MQCSGGGTSSPPPNGRLSHYRRERKRIVEGYVASAWYRSIIVGRYWRRSIEMVPLKVADDGEYMEPSCGLVPVYLAPGDLFDRISILRIRKCRCGRKRATRCGIEK